MLAIVVAALLMYMPEAKAYAAAKCLLEPRHPHEQPRTASALYWSPGQPSTFFLPASWTPPSPPPQGSSRKLPWLAATFPATVCVSDPKGAPLPSPRGAAVAKFLSAFPIANCCLPETPAVTMPGAVKEDEIKLTYRCVAAPPPDAALRRVW